VRAGARARPGSDRVRARAATDRAFPNHRRRTKRRSMRTMRRTEGRKAAGEARTTEKCWTTRRRRRRRRRTTRTWTRRPLGELMKELGTRQRPIRSSRAEEATAIATDENIIERVSAYTSGKERDMGTTSGMGMMRVRVIIATRSESHEKLQLHTSSRPRSCNRLITMGRCTVNNRRMTERIRKCASTGSGCEQSTDNCMHTQKPRKLLRIWLMAGRSRVCQ
jgi:hypothetical protein